MLVPMEVWPFVLKVRRRKLGSGGRKFCKGMRRCVEREAVVVGERQERQEERQAGGRGHALIGAELRPRDGRGRRGRRGGRLDLLLPCLGKLHSCHLLSHQ